jgi:AraC-like DNA-binding protein
MQWPYIFLLTVSCSFMLLQAVQSKKQTKHYLFAIFCGSMVMVSLQNLSAPSFGVYQYVFGLGTCATCNMVWLISRSLFRDKNAINIQHVAVAGVIALLIMLNNTGALLKGLDMQAAYLQHFKGGMNEILNLLSSTILMLSLYEAVRNFSTKTSAQKRQRVVFASAFVFGIFNCTILPTFFESQALVEAMMPYLVSLSAGGIMLSIQVVIWLQKQNDIAIPSHDEHCMESSISKNSLQNGCQTIDLNLVDAIQDLIEKKQVYLQANLKIADIARALNTPEYKISRVVRYHFKSPNFNHFINTYRVEHAKQLIASEDAANWSLLVISLESGFSSVVTFNRAFKSMAGLLPSEYKSNLSFH